MSGWVDEVLPIVFFKLIKQNKWTERYLYGIICSVQCVIMTNLFQYVHIHCNNITTKRIQNSSYWENRTALIALYTAIKLLFFYIFLTVFSILKRRHILFLSPYSALSKIKGILYNPVQKTQKNSSVENIPEKQMISGQE